MKNKTLASLAAAATLLAATYIVPSMAGPGSAPPASVFLLPPGVESLQTLQAPPLVEGCTTESASTRLSETEVHAAIDPADRNHIFAAWHQGQLSSAGALALGYAVTFNGGTSWTTGLIPGFTQCGGGGEWVRAGDPYVSIGPDGTVYVTAAMAPAAAVAVDFLGERTGLLAISRDGGLTWEEPIELYRDSAPGSLVSRPDAPKVTADPEHPGRLYLTYTERFGASLAASLGMFQRSDDDGATWTEPTVAFLPTPTRLGGTLSGIRALPNGNLAAIMVEIDITLALPGARADTLKTYSMFSVVSSNGGQTWSKHVILENQQVRSRDPERGERAILGCWGCNLAIAPDGTLWTVTPRNHRDPVTLAQTAKVTAFRSTDGGVSWTHHDVGPMRPGFANIAAIEVSSPGRVGVLYMDSRNDVLGDNVLTANVWYALSTNGGATWTDHQVGEDLDVLRYPPWGTNTMPGDYWGFVSMGNGKLAAFFPATTASGDNGTDMTFARLRDGTTTVFPPPCALPNPPGNVPCANA